MTRTGAVPLHSSSRLRRLPMSHHRDFSNVTDALLAVFKKLEGILKYQNNPPRPRQMRTGRGAADRYWFRKPLRVICLVAAATRGHVHVRSVVHTVHAWCGSRSSVSIIQYRIATCATGHWRFASGRRTILRGSQQSSARKERGNNRDTF
jgi:hypothetical protein